MKPEKKLVGCLWAVLGVIAFFVVFVAYVLSDPLAGQYVTPEPPLVAKP